MERSIPVAGTEAKLPRVRMIFEPIGESREPIVTMSQWKQQFSQMERDLWVRPAKLKCRGPVYFHPKFRNFGKTLSKLGAFDSTKIFEKTR